MNLKNNIAELQLTRGEFLKLIAVALLSAFGVARLLDSISQQAGISRRLMGSRRVSARIGFGSGRFGT